MKINLSLKHIASLLFISSILLACNTANDNPVENKEDTVELEEFQELTQEEYFTELVNRWNKAHIYRDMEALAILYHKNVLFYGVEMSKNQCIQNKRALFNQAPDFQQQIVGSIDILEQSETEVKCLFKNRVTVNRETTDFPQYLVFTPIGNTWLIAVESDLVTDRNMRKDKEAEENAED